MANLQLLRKRLRSVNTTGEMASAMKTVASVKYSKLSKVTTEFKEYAQSCAYILDLIADSAFKRKVYDVCEKDCYIVISSNRGFCGGYNTELFKFLMQNIKDENVQLIACGNKAQKYFAEKNITAESFEISDIPTYEQSNELTTKIIDIYSNGKAKNVYLVYQRFVNMMTQVPTMEKILPRSSDGGNGEENVLYLPDRETFSKNLAFDCLSSRIYGILLGSASGAQSSTVIAMKNACDNAAESSQQLETTINRVRQAQVTNSVIETSSGMASQNMEN